MSDVKVPKGMQPKTITKVIRKKMDNWIESIVLHSDADLEGKSDEEKKAIVAKTDDFQHRVRNAYIVTGGAITSMLLGETPNDFDVYFSDMDVAIEVTKYYLDKMTAKTTDFVPKIEVVAKDDGTGVTILVKSMGILSDSEEGTKDYRYFENMDPAAVQAFFNKHFEKPSKSEKQPYFPMLVTSNAISLSNDVQLIIRFVGEPEQIHDNYDFIHCTNYFTHKKGLVLNVNALTSIMSRQLYYSGSLYPVCAMFRIKKFLLRGWNINAGEMLKIAWDINNLNLSDPNVLYDQLVGCDTAYFIQVIELLKKKENIDRTYIISVIDRVFNGDEDEFEMTEALQQE